MRAGILEGHDFDAWRSGHARGERPSALPYGLDHLSPAIEVSHCDATHADGPVSRLLRSRDARLPYVLRYRGALGQVVTSLPLLARCDVCVSIFEHHADVYSRLRARAKRTLPPMVLISCYLSEWLTGNDEGLRRRAMEIARGAAAITVFSANQVEIVRDAAGVPVERITVIPYGIDIDFYTPADEANRPAITHGAGSPYVAAIGKDDGRDWWTFLEAAALTPEIPYRLATAPRMLEGLHVPDNVHFLGEVGHDAYRQLLRDSALVVVPTHDFAYPTGQSVLLETIACGRPAVVTATNAMRDYLSSATAAYALHDPRDLARVVSALWRDEPALTRMTMAARPIAEECFSTRRMWSLALPAITASARARRRPR